MNAQVQDIFSFFPVLFVGMWLTVTTLLGFMSGWFRLQKQYPAQSEPSQLTLRMRSGRMGAGVNMNGILTLSAGPSGLRVSILRLFRPFEKPFTVPWDHISVESRSSFFLPMAKLTFGNPEIGNLTIDARLWQRLAVVSPKPDLVSGLPEVSVRRSAYGMILAWLMISGLFSAFFYFAPRLSGDVGLPAAVCLLLPATFIGMVMLVRFLRQVR